MKILNANIFIKSKCLTFSFLFNFQAFVMDAAWKSHGKVMESGFCFPGLEKSWNLWKSDKSHGKVMDFSKTDFDYQNA